MSRINRLRPLAGLLAMGLAAPAFADPSVPFPTYVTGPQPDGSWIVGSGQVITPAGTQVYYIGDLIRAKAVALNPNAANHTAAVLTMNASATSSVAGTVEVFDTLSGDVLQYYIPFGNKGTQDATGSYGGITYSADGKYLLFSQDSSNVTLANVSPEGYLSDYAQVSVPPNNSFIQCFSNSPTMAYGVPCGTFYTPDTSYPGAASRSLRTARAPTPC